jgi:hypothetical protein
VGNYRVVADMIESHAIDDRPRMRGQPTDSEGYCDNGFDGVLSESQSAKAEAPATLVPLANGAHASDAVVR